MVTLYSIFTEDSQFVITMAKLDTMGRIKHVVQIINEVDLVSLSMRHVSTRSTAVEVSNYCSNVRPSKLNLRVLFDR